MVSRDANNALQQRQREEEAEERKRERSGSESSTDAPSASSSYSVMNNTFRVDSRYSALKAIGKGSFGFVCSALDEKQVRTFGSLLIQEQLHAPTCFRNTPHPDTDRPTGSRVSL